MTNTDFSMGIHTDLDYIIKELTKVAENEIVFEELDGKIFVIIMALKNIQKDISERMIEDNRMAQRQREYKKEVISKQ